MAIVVLVFWLCTAGAGFYLLVTSSLGRARPTEPAEPAPAPPGPPAPAPPGLPAPPTPRAPAPATPRAPAPATPGPPAPARSAPPSQPRPAAQATAATQTAAATPTPATVPAARATLSRQETRRAARDRWDPPSLTAAKQAPMIPGARSVLEFAHPACAVIGFGFWLGFTLVHNRALGWIAFGLVTFTACMGLAWFSANVRAAKRGDRPAPYFSGRLMVLHGCAAALLITLAALTALVARG